MLTPFDPAVRPVSFDHDGSTATWEIVRAPADPARQPATVTFIGQPVSGERPDTSPF